MFRALKENSFAKVFLLAFAVAFAGVCRAELAVPSNVVASSNLTTGISLSWSKVSGAASYIVYRYGGMSSQTGLFTATVTSNGFFDASAPVRQNMPYRVRAVGADGSLSGYSAYARGWREIVMGGGENKSVVVPNADGAQGLSFAVECNVDWNLFCDDWIVPVSTTFAGANGFTNVVFSVKSNTTGKPRRGRIVAQAHGMAVTNFVLQGSALNLASNAVQAVGESRIAPIAFADGYILESAAFVPCANPLTNGVACLCTTPMGPGDKAYIKFTPKRDCTLSFDWWKSKPAVGELKVVEGDSLDDPWTSSPLSSSSSAPERFEEVFSGTERPIWIVYEKGTGDSDAGEVFLANFRVSYQPTSLRVEDFTSAGFSLDGNSSPVGAKDTFSFRTIATYYDGTEAEVNPTIDGGYYVRRVGDSLGEDGVTMVCDDVSYRSTTISLSRKECGITVRCTLPVMVLPSLNQALDNDTLVFQSHSKWLYCTSGAFAASQTDGDCAYCRPPADGGSTVLRTTVPGNTYLSFKWAAITEPGHSALRCLVDGEEVASITGTSTMFKAVDVKIDGEGEHEVRWEWVKDSAGTCNGECAYLDDVHSFTVPGPVADLRLSEEVYPGMVRMSWNPADHAQGYKVYCRPEGETEWVEAGDIPGADSCQYDFEFAQFCVENGIDDASGVFSFRVCAYSTSDGLQYEGTASNVVEAEGQSALDFVGSSLFVVSSAATSPSAPNQLDVICTYPWWAAYTDDDWITVMTTYCEDSLGSLDFRVAANTTGAPRVGTITVRATDGACVRQVTVIQSCGTGNVGFADFHVVGPKVVTARDYADYSLSLDIDGTTLTGITNVTWKTEAFEVAAPFYIYNFADGEGGCAGRFFSEDVEYPVLGQVSAQVRVNGAILPGEPNIGIRVNPRPATLAPEGVELDLGDGDAWFCTKYNGERILRSGELMSFLMESVLRAKVIGPGILRFEWMQPCGTWASELSLMLDYDKVATCLGSSDKFTEVMLEIPEGSHDIFWSYYKIQPHYGDDDFGAIRNLRWDPATDTGNTRLVAPTNILPGGAAIECKFCSTYQTEAGELIFVPLAVTNAAVWSVYFDDPRTAAEVECEVTEAGTLQLTVSDQVKWNDTAYFSCSNEVHGVVREEFLQVPITYVPLETVLDCSGLSFSLYAPGGSNEDSSWRISDSDKTTGDYSMRASGVNYYGYTENSGALVKTMLLGEGTLEFDWRLYNGKIDEDSGRSWLRLFVDGESVWDDNGRGLEWSTASVRITGNSLHTVSWCFSGYNNNHECEAFLDHVRWTLDDPSAQPVVTGIRLEGPTEVTGMDSFNYQCYLQLETVEGAAEYPFECDWRVQPILSEDGDWDGGVDGFDASKFWIMQRKEEITEPGTLTITAEVSLGGNTYTESMTATYGTCTPIRPAIEDQPFPSNLVLAYAPNWYGTLAEASVGGSSARTVATEEVEFDNQIQFGTFGHGDFSFDCRTVIGVGHGALQVFLDEDMDNPVVTLDGTNDWRRVTVSIPEPDPGDEETDHIIRIRWVTTEGVTLADGVWIDNVAWSGTVMPPICDAVVHGPSCLRNGESGTVAVGFYRQRMNGEEIGQGETDGARPVAVGDDLPEVTYSYSVPSHLQGVVSFTENTADGTLTVNVPDSLVVGGTVTVTASFRILGEVRSETIEIDVFRPCSLRQALDNTNLVFRVQGPSAAGEWFGALEDGAPDPAVNKSLARSGCIGVGQSTSFSTTLEGPGTLTFNWKTSCRYVGSLYYTIDGEYVEDNYVAEDSDYWTSKTITLEEGTHVVTWTYSRGYGSSDCKDCGYVDNIQWTGGAPAVTPEPEDVVRIPAGVTCSFDGENSWFRSQWMGMGILRNARGLPEGGESVFSAEVTGPGVLRFDWMLSQAATTSGLSCALDGETVADCPRTNVALAEGCLVIPEGVHQIDWTFVKGVNDDDDEDFAMVRNLRWEAATYTGAVHLSGPVKLVADGGVREVQFRRVIQVASGETFDVPQAVTSASAWTVAFGDPRTEAIVDYGVSTDGTLLLAVDEGMDWEDVATIVCTVEIGGAEYSAELTIPVGEPTLNDALDCYDLAFCLREPMSWSNRDDDAWWRITTDDANCGGSSMTIGGYMFQYGSPRQDLMPAIKGTVIGSGTLTFDWRLDVAPGVNRPSRSALYLYQKDIPADGSSAEAGVALWGDAGVREEDLGRWTTATVHVNGSGLHELEWCFNGMNYQYAENVYLDHVTWTPDNPADAPRVTGVRVDGSAELMGGECGSFDCVLRYEVREGAEWVTREIPIQPDAWSFTPLSGAAATDWYADLEYVGKTLDVWRVDEDISEAGSFAVGVRLSWGGQTFTDELVVTYPRNISVPAAVLDAGPFALGNAVFRDAYGWFGTFGEAHVGEASARTSPSDGTEWNTYDLQLDVYGPGTVTFDCKVSSAANNDVFYVYLDWDTENPIAVISGEADWQTVTINVPPAPEDEEEYGHSIQFLFEDNGDGVVAGENCAWIDNVTWSGTTLLPVEDCTGLQGPAVVPAGSSGTFGVDFFRRPMDEKDWASRTPAVGDDVPEVFFNFDIPEELQDFVIPWIGDRAGQFRFEVADNLPFAGTVTVTAMYEFWGELIEESRTFEVVKTCPLRTALDNADLDYELSGEANWFGQLMEGAVNGNAARSGAVPVGGRSVFRATLLGPGTLTFKWKVSCEEWCGALVFSVLDQDIEPIFINGETGWVTQTLTLTEATNVVEWAYEKSDLSFSENSDGGWVDNITWTGSYLPPVDEPETPEAVETSRGVPYAWLQSFSIDPNGDKWETTEERLAANGKNTVRECYIAGLDPTNPTNEFTAVVTMTNGVPYVTWTPDLGVEREYIVKGKVKLDDPEWVAPTNSTHRFFKVEIKWDK